VGTRWVRGLTYERVRGPEKPDFAYYRVFLLIGYESFLNVLVLVLVLVPYSYSYSYSYPYRCRLREFPKCRADDPRPTTGIRGAAGASTRRRLAPQAIFFCGGRRRRFFVWGRRRRFFFVGALRYRYTALWRTRERYIAILSHERRLA
jgi:hypothetical protein